MRLNGTQATAIASTIGARRIVDESRWELLAEPTPMLEQRLGLVLVRAVSHEIGHYWGVFLDTSFGFGVGTTYNSRVHWGYAGVNGILGGFDPTTLSCQTPLGAAPMDCEPTANGRYRYSVESFSPGGNDLPYALLELYLMGLAAADECAALGQRSSASTAR